MVGERSGARRTFPCRRFGSSRRLESSTCPRWPDCIPGRRPPAGRRAMRPTWRGGGDDDRKRRQRLLLLLPPRPQQRFLGRWRRRAESKDCSGNWPRPDSWPGVCRSRQQRQPTGPGPLAVGPPRPPGLARPERPQTAARRPVRQPTAERERLPEPIRPRPDR